jgi:hypothetical protein
MTTLRTLLTNVIDYAGLFPPASLDVHSAVSNYAAYLSGEDSWALGRFIVPVVRLDEFGKTLRKISTTTTPTVRLSVLGSGNSNTDIAAMNEFNRTFGKKDGATAIIEALEMKAASVDEIREAARLIPPTIERYFEIPIDSDPSALVSDIADAHASAKVRTGGTQQEAFPSSADLLRFITACVKAGVPFKATAGLHHPLRSIQKLTYRNDSPSGMMFGLLNVFLTAAFVHAGMNDREALQVLEEQSPNAFRFSEDGVQWGTYRLTVEQLRYVRARVAVSFGSCSFLEPLDDLRSLNLL